MPWLPLGLASQLESLSSACRSIYPLTQHSIFHPQKRFNNIKGQICAATYFSSAAEKMNPIDDTKETVTFRAVSRDEEGRKRVEKVEVDSHDVDTLKYIQKKLTDKGVQRQDRRPVDGIPLGRQHKSGHGGKYTWEGPWDTAENELCAAPPAIDENDPNYVDEEAEDRIRRGEVSGVAGLVVGELEVPKLAAEGVARIDVDPQLQTNI